ncbi:hypothetical protein BGZ89_008580 [Linnemannia elongata]|nr:hypothetical protein BGZ89_008580 [Linnemannia elongata]
MGVLDIICLTTDPDSTAFYGFAYADSNDCNFRRGSCTNYVLVKSNTNPTSGSTVTWSLVSKINNKNMTGNPIYIYNTRFSCAINAQGVFTMFGWTYYLDRLAIPFGVRYDPAGTMDAKYNFQGSGAWMNVTIDQAYNWTGSTNKHTLGYVNNGVTTDLVHAVISGDGNNIYVAKVDESTKTLTAAGNWALNATMHGVIKAMGIGNNHLYTFGESSSFNASLCSGYFCLTGFPLVTISPTTPVGKIYNASQVYQTYKTPAAILYTYQNTLTLIAAQSDSPPSTIYKINDPENANSTGLPVANFTNAATNMDFFVPLGDGTSPTSFALMKQNGLMYVFGNDNGARYTREINKVNITDSVGIDPNPGNPSSDSASSEGDSPSMGVVIGAVVGVVLLGGLILWLTRRARTADTAKATTTAVDKPVPPFPPLNTTNHYVYPQQPGQTGGHYYPSGQYPAATTYPLGQSVPTTILPMAPITPVPQHHQTYLDQIQALQLSTHPRPSFAITAAGEHETATVAPAMGVPQSCISDRD